MRIFATTAADTLSDALHAKEPKKIIYEGDLNKPWKRLQGLQVFVFRQHL